MTVLEEERTETVLRLADVLAPVGDIPHERILWDPLPGTATEADLIHRVGGEPKVLVELIDGILVEKPMSAIASFMAATLLTLLNSYVRAYHLGLVGGADLMTRVTSRRTRLPDVSFVSWSRLHGLSEPTRNIIPFAPDLVVEVLSPSNTRAEMKQKLRDYFSAGARLAWIIDPDEQEFAVYTTASACTKLYRADTLTGGEVLPGFCLSLDEFFSDPQIAYFQNEQQPE